MTRTKFIAVVDVILGATMIYLAYAIALGEPSTVDRWAIAIFLTLASMDAFHDALKRTGRV